MEDNKRLTDEELYALAVKRVAVKRDFITHLFVYIAVNCFLWWIDATYSPGTGWHWWVVLGWGIGIVCHGADTYAKLCMDQGAVQREIKRLRDKGM